jgi:MT0933-like antitoxin protein
MSAMDKLKAMLKGNEEKVSRGIDKAADMVDSKTKGKYSDKIKSGSAKAKDAAKQYGQGEQGGGGGNRGQGPGH